MAGEERPAVLRPRRSWRSRRTASGIRLAEAIGRAESFVYPVTLHEKGAGIGERWVELLKDVAPGG